MTSKTLDLFFAVLMSTCILIHCLDEVGSPKTLSDAEIDFASEDQLRDVISKNNHEVKKRIVNPSLWKQEKEQPQKNAAQSSKLYPVQNPSIGSNWEQSDDRNFNSHSGHIGASGQFNSDWTSNQFAGHSYEFHQQNPLIPPGNSKWGPSNGPNALNNQDSHNKDDEEWYEGISSESTKSRKEKLPTRPSSHSSHIVAKYHPNVGVQCPTADATGLFVYPPDCRFYVTCWNGRAFVQPCAPGTLFSPDTLECDFPHKVKCYGGEIADFASSDFGDDTKFRESFSSQSQTRLESQGELELTCPPDLNGLLAHPSDCTKFLQCANGNTYIMDCGPGTVFNSLISVCDWPRNVKGCEDTIPIPTPGRENESDLSNPYRSESSNIHTSKSEHISQHNTKKIVCPSDFEGLLPHPEICEKFLQCANGNTYILECGPGTVFNPLTTVCDWPYNVPGCGSKNPSLKKPSINSQTYGHTASSIQPNLPHNLPSYGQSTFSSRPNTNPAGNSQDQSWNAYGYQSQNQGGFVNSANNQGGSNINPESTSYGQNWNAHGYQNPGDFESSANNQGGSGIHQHGYNHQSSSWYNQQGNSHYGGSKGSMNNQGSSINKYGSGYPDHIGNPYRQEGRNNENYGTPVIDSQYQGSSLNKQQSQNHGHGHHHTRYHHQHQHHHVPVTTPPNNPTTYLPYNHTSHPVNTYSSHEESSESSEEANSSQGYAWSEPVSQSANPSLHAPSDRRKYSRKNDKAPTNFSSGVDEWSVQETSQSQPGSFRPSTWRGLGPGFEQRPSYSSSNPIDEDPKLATTNNKPYDRPMNPNIYNSNDRQWTAASIPLYNRTQNVHPTRIFVSVNGTRNHFITKPLIIDQGHSKTSQQTFSQQENSRTPKEKDLSSSGTQNVMYVPASKEPVTWKPKLTHNSVLNITMQTGILVEDPKQGSPEILDSNERNKEFIYNGTDSNVPTVSIELEEDWNSSVPITRQKVPSKESPINKKFRGDTEPESLEADDFDVEVQTDEKKQWKPQLVFPNNKKKNSNDEKSVVMKVNKHTPAYLLDVEVAPFLDAEPPFPVYYAPPVMSASLVTDSYKSNHLTPISGQVIRLRGGSNQAEGYLEVQGDQPGWGVVCDTRNGWTLKEANIVCKQLGYGRGAALAWQGRPKTSQVPTWIAATSVDCHGNETRFQHCKFTHKSECKIEEDAVAVRCLPHRIVHCRKDELPHNGQCYHFADANQALNHAEAHDYCHKRGSRLIDLVDQLENNFVSELLIQNQPHVDSIMTSGMGFTTMNRTIWMWEDSSIATFKFNKWWPGWLGDRKSAPFAGSRPVCIIMTRKFPCHDRPENNCKTDYFFWNVEDCASSNKGHAYICERPYDDVGCVYGNGNQYYGNASIAGTGRECLAWSDPVVARSLVTKVPNREMRDKLRSHNFCRNPNPNKESRPWCFTGPRGEYDYCDIPYCGKVLSKKSHLTGNCKPKHFECLPGECIPSPWVCDGEEDCTNGADERKCSSYISFFKKTAKHKLDGYEVEKWLNTPVKTCALRCKEADFTCRSFTHQADGNICFLSDSNVGMTGALVASNEHDYYEMRDHTLDCDDMFVCANQKCINRTRVCDGKNDCLDRSDEKICTVENLDYEIRLAGANSSHEGRVEVKILGRWGQVCDDSFDMTDAGVVCRELGFNLGALEVRPGGFYGNLDPPDSFMVDQLKCLGNESTIRECDFEGWGRHNCEPEEAVGIICKTDVDTCQEGQWKCDNSPMCIPTPFICDEVSDCPNGADESPEHCDAPFELRLANGSSPMEGRVEIRHHGIWGTVCDDDFSNATAKVICRSLGYGGPAMIKKNGYFGPGTGPIWLDEVFCYGNETQLYRCEHDHWGRHNCDHFEDAGVICTAGDIPPEYEGAEVDRPVKLPEIDVNDLLPTECGKRLEDFDEDDELMFERVVRSSIAPRGSYPWQASIRVRGHSKSSHWCGAVILSPLHVLTAAHCLEGYNKGTYFVRAGDYNTEVDEGTEAEANIEDYYVHEDFRKGHRLNNDIAVVLLKGRGIPLGRNVMPICLPHENIEYPAGLNCTISGFGSVEAGSSTHSRKLRFGWVPILDQQICKADYVYGQGSITDGMICAGHLDGGPDTCDGDSGGPLACPHNGAFTLYGLTSWGQHCGRANKPGVYVRIAHYRKWIDEKIKESLIGR